jgi:peptidoglycan/LPS O-acetylase OafA/YrhL
MVQAGWAGSEQIAFTLAYLLASVCACLAVAWLSHQLIERHFLDLKHRFPFAAVPAPASSMQSSGAQP